MPFVKDWIIELFFYQGIPVKFSSFLSQLKCRYTKYISQLTQTFAFMFKWPSPGPLVVIWFHGYARPSLKMFGNWIKCSQLWELCQMCDYAITFKHISGWKGNFFSFCLVVSLGTTWKHWYYIHVKLESVVIVDLILLIDHFLDANVTSCPEVVKKSWHSPLVPYPLVLLTDSLVAFMD